jgi:hypothetical protein
MGGLLLSRYRFIHLHFDQKLPAEGALQFALEDLTADPVRFLRMAGGVA